MTRAATDKRFIHYRSITPSTIPIAADLEQGELFVNLADRAVYTKDQTNAVVLLNPDTAVDNTLTSTDTTVALSAAQGKVLNDKIDGLGTIHNAPDNTGRDDLATAGTVDSLDVVHVDDDGDGKWARYQNLGTSAAPVFVKISDEDALAAGLGATNLGVTATPTGVTVTNTSGSDAPILPVDATNAGLMIPADKAKLDLYPATPIDSWVDLDDTAAAIVAGSIVQANAAGTALEFNNALDGGLI